MIYYIYKVRRKQTSIRSSRSALPHRYLRYISWISWNGRRPPRYQPSISWGFSVPCHSRAHHFRGGAYVLRLRQLRSCCQKVRKTSPDLSPEKKKKHLSPLFSRTFACRFSCVALPTARACCPRPIRGRSTACSCGPPINKKCGPAALRREPAKSVDFSLKKNARRHAWLSRSCFGRKNLFIDGPHSLPLFFLSPFLQGKEKRKQKQIQQVRIHRSDSLRSSSRCTRLARRASSAEIYVAIATRFVQDCVEDLAVLTASMERIPKCSWHIKDHYLGVNKASRIFLLLLRFLSPQNLSPQKFDFSQKI